MRRKTSERFACRSAEAAGKPEPERRRLERCRKVPGMLEKPGMPPLPTEADGTSGARNGTATNDKTTRRQYDNTTHVTNIENH